jgi:outer membrane protein TolC
MPDKHEPDPRFVDNLEWQLKRELRRNRASTATRQIYRVLKIAALMLGSVALGAAAMGASQQLQESWRRELLEARLEVRLQLAQQRFETQRDAIELTRGRVEQGVVSGRELMFVELQIAQAEADVTVIALELEEIRSTGREPLGELSSPLVDGRDFVSEKINARMQVARERLDVVQRSRERTRQQVDLGVVTERELRAQDLSMLEAEQHLEILDAQLEIRRSYLDSEISAVEAELKLLELEAQSQVILLEQRLEHVELDLGRLLAMIELGVVHQAEALQMTSHLEETEAELRLAQEELDIVRRELERRAAQR